MTRRLTALALALVLALSLTGCWEAEPEPDDFWNDDLPSPSEEEPQREPAQISDFTLPYLSGQTFDPVTCIDGVQQTVGALLYEPLFTLDNSFAPQPVLCEHSSCDAQALTWTFALRSAVFSDGTALTANDVLATYRRAAESARYGARFANVASMKAQDAHTLIVTLTRSNGSFPALLDIPIVKAGTESNTVPTGTGPYVYSSEGGPHLTSNQSWWQSGTLPVETVGLSPAEDRDTMLYQFTSHDIQLITADLTGTAPVSVTGSISFQDADTAILQYVGFNAQKAPFNNAALRAAMNLGINRPSVVSAYLSGHGAAAQFPISPVSPLYPSELEETYSHDAFASAMADAGFASGASRTATLLVNSENSFKVAAAEQIARSLSAFDLDIEVLALPWEEYTAALAAGQFDLYYAEVKLTANWDLTPLLATGGALGAGGCSRAQTDQLLASCAAAADRGSALKNLCAHLRQQAPILPVCFKSTSILVQAGVTEGLTPTMANPFYNLTSCTIHLREK